MDSLQFVAGIDGIRITALLAAIGFLGGIFPGLIASVIHSTRHRWYRDWT